MPPTTGRLAEDLFRRWLAARLSGCQFAAGFGKGVERAYFYEPLTAIDTVEVATVFDQCAERKQVVVLLVPSIRRAEEVADLVGVLAAHQRWRASIDSEMAPDPYDVGIRLAWTTREGRTTHAMGFAPFASMPVTRRAPYVALAAWTGGHENTVRSTRSEEFVTMGDAPPRMKKDKYQAVRKTTSQETRTLLEGDASVEAIRNLAFRLPRDVVKARLSGLR